MSDQDTLNIETKSGKNGKHLDFTRLQDGRVSVEIRITRNGHSLVGECIIPEDRRNMIADFLRTACDQRKA